MARLVVKLPLPAVTLVQIGTQVLSGDAILVLVKRYIDPAPVFVTEIVRVVPEMIGWEVNCKLVIPAGPVTTLKIPVFGSKL